MLTNIHSYRYVCFSAEQRVKVRCRVWGQVWGLHWWPLSAPPFIINVRFEVYIRDLMMSLHMQLVCDGGVEEAFFGWGYRGHPRTDKEDVSALSLGERPLRVGVACLQFKPALYLHVRRNMNGFLFAPCCPRPTSPEPVGWVLSVLLHSVGFLQPLTCV